MTKNPPLPMFLNVVLRKKSIGTISGGKLMIKFARNPGKTNKNFKVLQEYRVSGVKKPPLATACSFWCPN